MWVSPAQGAAGHNSPVPCAEGLAGQQVEGGEDHRGRGRQWGRGQAQQHQDGALHGCVTTRRIICQISKTYNAQRRPKDDA